MDFIEEYGTKNSRMTLELEQRIKQRNTPHLISGFLTVCEKCGSRGSLKLIDRRVGLKMCGECEEIFQMSESPPIGGATGQRDTFCSAQTNARPRSVYLPVSHLTNWLGRLTGVQIPHLPDPVVAEVERRLQVRGLLRPPETNEEAMRRLRSFTFWFELLKYPVDSGALNISTYYYNISYFMRCYCPGQSELPVFTSEEKAEMLRIFVSALDLFTNLKQDLRKMSHTSANRKNFWSYGLFISHVLEHWGRRGQQFLTAYPHQLRRVHVIADVQRNSGRLFHTLFYQLSNKIGEQYGNSRRLARRHGRSWDKCDDNNSSEWCPPTISERACSSSNESSSTL